MVGQCFGLIFNFLQLTAVAVKLIFGVFYRSILIDDVSFQPVSRRRITFLCRLRFGKLFRVLLCFCAVFPESVSRFLMFSGEVSYDSFALRRLFGIALHFLLKCGELVLFGADFLCLGIYGGRKTISRLCPVVHSDCRVPKLCLCLLYLLLCGRYVLLQV